MKVLVCGGRNYANWRRVEGFLDLINGMYGPITCIVTGACCDKNGDPRGADWWAERWARKRGVRYAGYPANFTKYGRPAGPIRNQVMLDEQLPSIVLALPGGPGTADMVGAAEKFGLQRRGPSIHDGTVVLYNPELPEPAPLELQRLCQKDAGGG